MRAAPPLTVGILAMMASISCLAADPLYQAQVSLTQGSSNTWNADWIGATGRTYFVQVSTDLVNWAYCPNIDFGAGVKSMGVNAGGVPKFFLRLKYVDESSITTLQQARDADLDGDGIPSWYEVETIGTDPFDKTSAGGDLDADGLPDGWEKFYFGGTGVAVAGAVLQPDGLTNKQKADLGMNPNTDYTSSTASGVTNYTYSLVGRLIQVTGSVAGAVFESDEEGNILSAH